MKEHRRRPEDSFSLVTRDDLRKVLGRIRRNGPVSIRDIDDEVLVEKTHRMGEPQA